MRIKGVDHTGFGEFRANSVACHGHLGQDLGPRLP